MLYVIIEPLPVYHPQCEMLSSHHLAGDHQAWVAQNEIDKIASGVPWLARFPRIWKGLNPNGPEGAQFSEWVDLFGPAGNSTWCKPVEYTPPHPKNPLSNE